MPSNKQNLLDKHPKQPSDNPFLPPHIRERLAKQKMVLEDDAKAHQNALATIKNSASVLNGKMSHGSVSTNKPLNTDHSKKKHITDEEKSKSTDKNTEKEVRKTRGNNTTSKTNTPYSNHRDLSNTDSPLQSVDTSALVKEILHQNADILAKTQEKANNLSIADNYDTMIDKLVE